MMTIAWHINSWLIFDRIRFSSILLSKWNSYYHFKMYTVYEYEHMNIHITMLLPINFYCITQWQIYLRPRGTETKVFLTEIKYIALLTWTRPIICFHQNNWCFLDLGTHKGCWLLGDLLRFLRHKWSQSEFHIIYKNIEMINHLKDCRENPCKLGL